MSESILELDRKSILEWQKLVKDIGGASSYLPVWVKFALGQQADKYANYVKSGWIGTGRAIGSVTGETKAWLGAYARKERFKDPSLTYSGRGRPREYSEVIWVSVRPGGKAPNGAGSKQGTSMNFHGIWSNAGPHQKRKGKNDLSNYVRSSAKSGNGQYKHVFVGQTYTVNIPSGKEFMRPSFSAFIGTGNVQRAVSDNIERGMQWMFNHPNEES